jgi:threonine dehydrogenase-like Zn-dependent dehydrogenase
MTLPASARAAVLAAVGEPLEVRELPVPAPEPGALIVRVRAATVCGTDVHIWEGGLGTAAVSLPIVPGHEIVGEIVALGEGAGRDSVGRPLRAGDRVIWTHESCGRCHYCTEMRQEELCRSRRIGMFQAIDRFPYLAGGFAEYSYVWPRAGRLRVPDEVEDAWAAAASCALRTVVNAFNRLGPLDHRHHVVIQGAGPLGLFATALASLRSPRSLTVVGAPAQRLEIARRWGATATVDLAEAPDAAQRRERLLALTEGRGPDVLFELSGGRDAFAEGLELVAPGGRYMVVGTTGGGRQSIDAPLIVGRELTILSTNSANTDAFALGLELLARHRDRFDWNAMIGREYSLDRATDALRSMQRYEEIKAVIRPS